MQSELTENFTGVHFFRATLIIVLLFGLALLRWRYECSSGLNCTIAISEFDANFRALGLEKIPSNEKGNVDCHITGQDLTRALGPGWDSRCYHTSTQTYVSFKELIHLFWGYKVDRKFYRCTFF
jgi:hypothetical protein